MRNKNPFLCMMLFVLIGVLLCSCSNKLDTLDFDQIMLLENVDEGGNHDSLTFERLDELHSYYNSRGLEYYELIGTVLKTEYHICFSKEDMIMNGYTLITYSIESSTKLSLNKGDIITLKQDSFIQFKHEADAYSYVTGKSAGTQDEIIQGFGDLDSFDKVLELVPEIEYERHFRELDMPMKEGESYSLIAYKLEDSELFGFQYALPKDSTFTEFKAKYGLSFSEEYMTIGNEIRKSIVH